MMTPQTQQLLCIPDGASATRKQELEYQSSSPLLLTESVKEFCRKLSIDDESTYRQWGLLNGIVQEFFDNDAKRSVGHAYAKYCHCVCSNTNPRNLIIRIEERRSALSVILPFDLLSESAVLQQQHPFGGDCAPPTSTVAVAEGHSAADSAFEIMKYEDGKFSLEELKYLEEELKKYARVFTMHYTSKTHSQQQVGLCPMVFIAQLLNGPTWIHRYNSQFRSNRSVYRSQIEHLVCHLLDKPRSSGLVQASTTPSGLPRIRHSTSKRGSTPLALHSVPFASQPSLSFGSTEIHCAHPACDRRSQQLWEVFPHLVVTGSGPDLCSGMPAGATWVNDLYCDTLECSCEKRHVTRELKATELALFASTGLPVKFCYNMMQCSCAALHPPLGKRELEEKMILSMRQCRRGALWVPNELLCCRDISMQGCTAMNGPCGKVHFVRSALKDDDQCQQQRRKKIVSFALGKQGEPLLQIFTSHPITHQNLDDHDGGAELHLTKLEQLNRGLLRLQNDKRSFSSLDFVEERGVIVYRERSGRLCLLPQFFPTKLFRDWYEKNRGGNNAPTENLFDLSPQDCSTLVTVISDNAAAERLVEGFKKKWRQQQLHRLTLVEANTSTTDATSILSRAARWLRFEGKDDDDSGGGVSCSLSQLTSRHNCNPGIEFPRTVLTLTQEAPSPTTSNSSPEFNFLQSQAFPFLDEASQQNRLPLEEEMDSFTYTAKVNLRHIGEIQCLCSSHIDEDSVVVVNLIESSNLDLGTVVGCSNVSPRNLHYEGLILRAANDKEAVFFNYQLSRLESIAFDVCLETAKKLCINDDQVNFLACRMRCDKQRASIIYRAPSDEFSGKGDLRLALARQSSFFGAAIRFHRIDDTSLRQGTTDVLHSDLERDELPQKRRRVEESSQQQQPSYLLSSEERPGLVEIIRREVISSTDAATRKEQEESVIAGLQQFVSQKVGSDKSLRNTQEPCLFCRCMKFEAADFALTGKTAEKLRGSSTSTSCESLDDKEDFAKIYAEFQDDPSVLEALDLFVSNRTPENHTLHACPIMQSTVALNLLSGSIVVFKYNGSKEPDSMIIFRGERVDCPPGVEHPAHGQASVKFMETQLDGQSGVRAKRRQKRANERAQALANTRCLWSKVRFDWSLIEVVDVPESKNQQLSLSSCQKLDPLDLGSLSPEGISRLLHQQSDRSREGFSWYVFHGQRNHILLSSPFEDQFQAPLHHHFNSADSLQSEATPPPLNQTPGKKHRRFFFVHAVPVVDTEKISPLLSPAAPSHGIEGDTPAVAVLDTTSQDSFPESAAGKANGGQQDVPPGIWMNDLYCRDFVVTGECKKSDCNLLHRSRDQYVSELSTKAQQGFPVRFCLRYMRKLHERGYAKPCPRGCTYYHGTLEEENCMLQALDNYPDHSFIPKDAICKSYLENGKCDKETRGNRCHHVHPKTVSN